MTHNNTQFQEVFRLIRKAEEKRLKGKVNDAKTYLDQAQKKNSILGYKELEACILESLGYCYSLEGEYEKATKTANNAIAIFQHLSGDLTEAGKRGNANGLIQLGVINCKLAKFEEAIDYLQKGIAIAMEVGNEMSLGEAYGNLGEVYNEKGQHEKAIEFGRKSLEISQKTGNKYEEARSLHNIGNAFHCKGNFRECIKYCEKSSRMFKEIGNQNSASWSDGLLANCYGVLGDEEKSQACYKSCIDNNIKLERFRELAIAYGNKALNGYKIAFAKFLVCSEDAKESLENCIDLFKKAIENSDKILISLAVDRNKTAFSHKFYRWYDHLTGPFNLIGRTTAALLFLDLGRAKILRQLVCKQVKGQEEDSNFKSSWLTIENKQEKEQICTISRQIELLKSNATVLFYNFNVAKVLTIWILDANGSVYLKTSNPSSKTLNSGEELEKNINELLKKTSDRIPREYSFIQQSVQEEEGEETNHKQLIEESVDRSEKSRSPAKAASKSFDDLTQDPRFLLYRSLIDPVKGFIQGQAKLIIVPQSCIFFAPFSCFIDKDNRLLSEQYQIQIIPSFHVLAMSMQASRNKPNGGSLFIGNPTTNLPPLPSAEEEVKHLASLLDAKPIIGREATKRKLMECIPTASIIHIAAHGHNESGDIFLAPEVDQQSNVAYSTSSFEVLTQSDILQCKLSCARLVVLSCCHSAKGKLTSEGVLGIARSFLGAGASTVMVTLWPIDDEFTLEFMKIFYEKVFAEKSVCLALKETVNRFQKSRKYASYLYWAAFEIIGEDVNFTKSEIEEIRSKNKFLDPSKAH